MSLFFLDFLEKFMVCCIVERSLTLMRILLVEDNQDLCKNIALSLHQAGYMTDRCHTGSDGLYYAANQTYDAIVLDRMLPEIDGVTLLEMLRKRGIQTPVILATALDGLHDRIDGLDAGADDYIVKPYDVEELMARIRAITRRPGKLKLTPTLSFAGIILDPEQHELHYQSSTAALSRKEAALLEYLMRNTNQTLPRQAILSYVWGSDSEVEEGNLDNYIYFLRRRLKSLDAPVKVTTVHGVGYRLEELHV